MKDHLELPVGNVLREGVTTLKGYGGKQYVIYIDPQRTRWKIRVNADYVILGEVVRVCVHYDRALCDTVQELERMTQREIELQAYGAWMDGAR